MALDWSSPGTTGTPRAKSCPGHEVGGGEGASSPPGGWWGLMGFYELEPLPPAGGPSAFPMWASLPPSSLLPAVPWRGVACRCHGQLRPPLHQHCLVSWQLLPECQPRSSASCCRPLFPLVSLITTRVWRPLFLYLLIHLSPQVLPTMSPMPPPPLISLHGPLPGHPPPAFLSTSARVILLPCSLMGSASSTNTHPGFHGNRCQDASR